MKFYILISFAFLFLSACSSSKESGEENKPNTLVYNITITQGGGFTGGSGGYIIDTSGNIFSFEKPISSDPVKKSTGKLSNEQITEMNAQWDSVKDIKYNETGNMTTSILLKNNERELRFSWKGMEPDKSVPDKLVKFYNLLNKLIHNPKGV